MGALFSSPSLPEAPPPPPPPPDQGSVEVQQAALAQAGRMSMIGYKGSFKAGPRGEGPGTGGSGEGTTPGDTSADPGTRPPPPTGPGSGGGGGWGRPPPPLPGESRKDYVERMKQEKRDWLQERVNRGRDTTIHGRDPEGGTLLARNM